MIAEKYKEAFVNIPNNQKYKFLVNTVILKEKEFQKNSYEWNKGHISKYLKSFNSASPASINKYMSGLRSIVKFICQNENRNFNTDFNIGNEHLINCIDKEKILSVTINRNEYEFIKNKLILSKGINVRDKLLFELAWEGLSADELKYLKHSDIIFNKNKSKAIIQAERKHIIDDKEIIEDIWNCMEEKEYIVKTLTGSNITRVLQYNWGEYLFKPVRVGMNKIKKFYLTNPSTTLKNAFKINDIECKGIDMLHLSIENIRRSRIIESINNGYDFDDIVSKFNINNSVSLYWLKHICKLKYN